MSETPGTATGATNEITGSAWYVGLLYSLITVITWATLPLALAVTLQTLDAWTVTWFRMFIAALLLGGWLGFRGQLSANAKPSWWQLVKRYWPGLLVAALMLSGNYIFYLIGLDYTTPANSQVLIQLAPLFLALGGMVFFGERYNGRQWVGFLILISGLLLFFRNQLAVLGGNDKYILGVVLVVLAAITWAVYALVQKQLMRHMNSMQIMLFIYCCATVLMLPMAEFPNLMILDASAWLWLIFCGLNTLIAYGAFGEAMHHWQASRVSAVIAITPLATIGVIFTVSVITPDLVPPERLDMLSLIAAVMVVAGSMITSLAGRQRRMKPKPSAITHSPSRD